MNEIRIPKKYATITESKNRQAPNDDEVRIYCLQFPDVFNFQIRTHKGIGYNNGGTARDMIATVSLTIAEVEDILAQMKAIANS